MTRLQLLLNKLAEEAAEIAQIALKAAQFGINEVKCGQNFTNAERVHTEIDDLFAIIEMLNDEFEFGYEQNRERIYLKRIAANEYAKYSKQLGMLEEQREVKKVVFTDDLMVEGINIEPGWIFYSSDFTAQSNSFNVSGQVTLIRDYEERRRWNSMSKDLKDSDKGPPLFVSGFGKNVVDALVSANFVAAHAVPIPEEY